MAKSKKESGVEPFEPEDEVIEDSDDDDNDQEDDVSKETAKAKARRAEAETDDDEDDDEDVEDSAEDDDEEEDDDDDTEDDEFAGFKPFIVHDEQEWDLDEVLGSADGGETVVIYHLESGHWYKLQPIKVGEVPEV